MRYANIRKLDISNGDGIGISLFVQGCHFHCKDCFNYETWDFEKGNIWTKETKNTFINLANKDYITRITILGGEPLAQENARDVLDLIKSLRDKYGYTKKIWLYTGYYWNEIFNKPLNVNDPTNEIKKEAISLCDFVVDGRFITELKDFNYRFAGSTNQTVIDVKERLKK